MNFTREPIVETIISAKEGYKLSLKNSKTPETEAYLVDAVEVVSFGGSFFYRCQERPKAFFLPVGDYEVVEVRETRLLLKTSTLDRSVKIAGGAAGNKNEKSASSQGETKEANKKTPSVNNPGSSNQSKKETTEGSNTKTEKKERKRTRRSKRSNNDKQQANASSTEKKEERSGKSNDEMLPVFSALLKPPEGLISESLQKYKTAGENISSPEINEQLASSFSNSEEQPISLASQKELEAKKVQDFEEKKQVESSENPKQSDGEESKKDSTIVEDNLVSEAPKPGEKLEDRDSLEKVESSSYSNE